MERFINSEPFSTVENSITICNSSVTSSPVTFCDGYESRDTCYSTTLDLTSNGHALCCSYETGCRYLTATIATQFNDTYWTNREKISLRCDGGEACDGMTLDLQSGGNLYFTGKQAGPGRDATINGIYNYISNFSSDIYCTGYWSCEEMMMYNLNNIYCTARDACPDATIINITNNIYAYGYESLNSGIVSNIGNNIYCAGIESCDDLTATNIGNSIYGEGEQVLSSATITNVTNSVIGVGFGAVQRSNIYNVSTVQCRGYDCLRNADIYYVDKVIVYGNFSLRSASILTKRDSTFNIEIYGDNSDYYTLECDVGTVCIIDCQSQHACKGMYLDCHSDECYINCDPDKSIDCPDSGTYYPYPTLFPTHQPSNIPTVPTLMPSFLPSEIPSSIPTTNPTLIPTSMPTNVPSSIPSSIPTMIPTVNPTPNTSNPTTIPTKNPTMNPSIIPSLYPTREPIAPSGIPTMIPTINPTLIPTFERYDNYNYSVILTLILSTNLFEYNNDEIKNSIKLQKDLIYNLRIASVIVRTDLADISDIDVEILNISSGNNTGNTSSRLRLRRRRRARALASISYDSTIEFIVSFGEESAFEGWIFDYENVVSTFEQEMTEQWDVNMTGNAFSVEIESIQIITTETTTTTTTTTTRTTTTTTLTTTTQIAINTTDSSLGVETENDVKIQLAELETISLYTTISIVTVAIIIIIVSWIDAKFIHHNEMFKFSVLIVVTMYFMDVVSGLCV